MKKKEAGLQTRFRKWWKYNWNENSIFELKYCRGKALPFNAVKKHQIQNLQNAKHRKIFVKISDSAIGTKEADCFSLAKSSSYIVVQYASKKRANKTFYMIDVDVFSREMQKSDRKSLTEERAGQIGKKCQLGIIDTPKV